MTGDAWSKLAPSAISVARRPGFLGAAFAVRSVFAALIALALTNSVAASQIGEHPGGDALLFEDGGLFLLELLRISGPYLTGAVWTSAAILALALTSNLLVAAVLLVALGSEGRLGAAEAVARGVRVFPAFFLLGALILLAQSLLVLGASVVGKVLESAFENERFSDLAVLASALLLALLAVALGAVLDVARAAAVRHELGAKHALLFALDAARRSPRAVLLGWLPFAAFGALLVGCAALLAGKIDVAQPGSWRILAVGLVHQLTLLALLVLRAAWLAKALRLAARHEPSRGLALTMG